MTTSIIRENGQIIGAWERPRNISATATGSSIHDEAMALQLGFRGAFVSGRVHLNNFVPLLIEAFGRRWFERGTLSIEFRVGTLDQEEVRAVVSEPSADAADAQVAARLERPDGTVIATGTASVGDAKETTWLGAKRIDAFDQGPYDLVAAVTPGDAFPRVGLTLDDEEAKLMASGTVALPWYTSESPWGPPIASPALMVRGLGTACAAYLREHAVAGVVIDGGIELRNIAGPVIVGRPYLVSGEVLARGQSPRTEYFWYEAHQDDETGARIAEMRLQWRCAKEPAGT